MAKYRCIRKTYFQDRIWEEGSILNAAEANKHFALVKPGQSAAPEDEVKDPETFAEAQKQEAEQILNDDRGAPPVAPGPVDLAGEQNKWANSASAAPAPAEEDFLN